MDVLQRQNSWLSIAPLAADLLVMLLAIFLFLPLAHQLLVPAGLNALLVTVAFIAFSIGVYGVRKLEASNPAAAPDNGDNFLPSRLRGALAFLFGLVMAGAIAHQLGYFASIQVTGIGDINEGATAAFYSFAPGAWLGFAMLYVLVLAFPLRPTVSVGSARYTSATLFGLATFGFMLLVLAAELAVVLMPLSSLWGMIWFVALLLLLFLPPRILLSARLSPPGTPLFIASLITPLLPIIYCVTQLAIVN